MSRPCGAFGRNDHRSVSLDRHVNVTVAGGRLELVFVEVVRRVDLIIPNIHIALAVTVVSYNVGSEAVLGVCDGYDEESRVVGTWIESKRDLSNELVCPVRI